MRLNPVNGKAAMGISTNVSVDGVVPAPLVGVGAQLPRWLDAAGNVLVFVNVDTAQLCTIDLDTDTTAVVDTGEASRLGAGAGNWVRSRNTAGLDSNIGGFADQPLGGLADVDENGFFGVIQAFAADRGIVAYNAAGTELWRFDYSITPSSVPRARTDLIAISASIGASGTWTLYRLSTGAVVPFFPRQVGVVECVPLELTDGSIWVVERTGDDTLTLRGATQAQGYLLSSTIVYNPDVIELSPGVVRVGWSATPGEGVTALRMADITLGSGANTQWTTATGSLVSSTGAPISGLTSMGVVGGSAGRELQALLNHPIAVPQTGKLTTQWQKYFNRLAFLDAQPINLDSAEVTGVLPPQNGGTGGGTGTAVLNGANILPGTTPLTALASQAASTLVGRGSASAGSPEVITLGGNLTMTGTVLDSTGGGGGGWAPMTDGAEPPTLISNGAGQIVMAPYAP